jgi:hypothetical protein
MSGKNSAAIVWFLAILFLWAVFRPFTTYEIKLAGEDFPPSQLAVFEKSWWGFVQHGFPIRYVDRWEIYRDEKWNKFSYDTTYYVTAHDEIVGTEWPPSDK